jgi:hypothetical protein
MSCTRASLTMRSLSSEVSANSMAMMLMRYMWSGGEYDNTTTPDELTSPPPTHPPLVFATNVRRTGDAFRICHVVAYPPRSFEVLHHRQTNHHHHHHHYWLVATSPQMLPILMGGGEP